MQATGLTWPRRRRRTTYRWGGGFLLQRLKFVSWIVCCWKLDPGAINAFMVSKLIGRDDREQNLDWGDGQGKQSRDENVARFPVS